MGCRPAGGGTAERDDHVPVRICCSLERKNATNSFAAFGCGPSLKIAPHRGQTGRGSAFENAMSWGFPAAFSARLTLAIVSNVTRLSPEDMLRTTPRCPWMKLGWFAMYLSM